MKIDTYKNVCGANNPFSLATGVSSYGADANAYHAAMLAQYPETPVFNDYALLKTTVEMVFYRYQAKYAGLYKTVSPAFNPLEQRGETETITHSQRDEQRHTGKDTSGGGTTATDKTVSYDTDTLKTTAETTNRQNSTMTYGSAVATIYGHKIVHEHTGYSDGATAVDDYRKMANFSLFDIIIGDVIDAISCKVYIPDKEEF